MRNTFAKTLYEIGKKDERIAIVVADISPAGSMAAFSQEFPERFVNVGVAEQNMIGLCAGMALRGMKPFAYTIATFTIYRPFEFVRDDLCYQNLPVTVVGIGGGVTYSTLGGTHHTQEDISIMCALPNMSVVAPCDPLEVEASTWHSAKHNGPLYLRLGKAGEPNLTEKAIDPWTFGKVRYLRQGGDICLISYGSIMKMTMDIADALEKKGKRVSVVAAHTLKPLDEAGLAKILAKYPQVAVIEETAPHGSLSTQLKRIAWETGARCRVQGFTLKDEFIHTYGNHAELLKDHGLDVGLILNALSSM